MFPSSLIALEVLVQSSLLQSANADCSEILHSPSPSYEVGVHVVPPRGTFIPAIQPSGRPLLIASVTTTVLVFMSLQDPNWPEDKGPSKLLGVYVFMWVRWKMESGGRIFYSQSHDRYR